MKELKLKTNQDKENTKTEIALSPSGLTRLSPT